MPPSAKRWTPPSILPIPIMPGSADEGENTNGLIRQYVPRLSVYPGLSKVGENTNGLIRQYVPKGTPLNTRSDQQIHHIMDRLNHRPRKGLAFQTPYEILSKETGVQPKHGQIALTS